VEIYPLSRYYFGAKDARSLSDGAETAVDRALRLKSK
jgi:cleavage and polyadenylation specificity factor subunit 5